MFGLYQDCAGAGRKGDVDVLEDDDRLSVP